jgi:phospholipid transport system transporter-binding protein
VSVAALKPAGKRRWRLDGDLDFASVPGLWAELSKLIDSQRRVSLSLAGVRRANSAGLVLLVEARDLARHRGCALRLVDLPRELVDLASMSRCETLIRDG